MAFAGAIITSVFSSPISAFIRLSRSSKASPRFCRFRLGRSSAQPTPQASQPPAVSILRPLCGLDSNLEANLESAFLQQWPANKLEILLCVASADDPAVAVAEGVICKYPSVNARLLIVIGEERVGVNPKINNLVRAYRTATSDLLWILDSNVLVQSDTLARAVAAFEPATRPIGLVHHLPVAKLPLASRALPRLGSLLEYCFLNGNHARQYVTINSVAIESCLVGKSNLFFRSDLERSTQLRPPSGYCPPVTKQKQSEPFGGLECFGQFLGEDNMIGKSLWDVLDLRHALAPDPAFNIVGELSLTGYIRRRVRWIRVRKYMCLLPTLAEPFTESILLGALTAASLSRLSSTPFPALLFFASHILLYLLLDYTVLCSIQPQPELNLPIFGVGWLLREILALPIWFFAFVGGDGVQWRRESEKLEVTRDGRAVRVS
ncbi:hypothetical protein CROQUDRAFT_46578 [Cronartium quercuum f. sp. fusiforme G11]|uniref:Ceramide glucosyltransferase n=1 Tax=Cronartium quercuum f. sp. fusiforme G11 TaxID=708437 RepID=A0A9P6NFC5_9BASI|nr:hypothetical protein CROQUDRAFT_46578 [Cronartium quercuum f. sp. fusiforme G11]